MSASPFALGGIVLSKPKLSDLCSIRHHEHMPTTTNLELFSAALSIFAVRIVFNAVFVAIAPENAIAVPEGYDDKRIVEHRVEIARLASSEIVDPLQKTYDFCDFYSAGAARADRPQCRIMPSSISGLCPGRWEISLLSAVSAFAVACAAATKAEPRIEDPPTYDVPMDDSNAGEGTEGGEEMPPAEFGGTVGPAPLIVVSELPDSLPSTTPEALTLELHTNIDHIGVRAHLNAAGGVPIGDCESADIYRIGKDSVDWPVGGTFVLPLNYDRTLESGVYTQSIRIYLDGGYLDVTRVEGHAHFFEVADGRLRSITSTEYSDIVAPVMYAPDGERYYEGSSAPEAYEFPPPPCSEPEPYSDEVAIDEAISLVSFDSWQNVHTIQPLRWLPPETFSNGATSEQSVVFRARSAAGGRLRVEIDAPLEELGADFEASLAHELPLGGNHGRVILDEPGGTSWYSRGGTVLVDVREDGQLSIELSDIELEKSRLVTEPEVLRTVSSGTIAGAWILDSAL